MIRDGNLLVDEKLIQFQDEIRAEFRWSLDRDFNVANWLITELTSNVPKRRTVDDFYSTWASIKNEICSHEGTIAIVGAAVEIAEIEIAMGQGC